MNREELQELHFITAIENLPSIVEQGILSHVRAAGLPHCSIAMQTMQDRRAQVVVPRGRRLHEYANLYICGRNPMLYLRRHQPVCVLAVSTAVLDVPGVIVTDENAGGDYVSFHPAPQGLCYVDRESTFAEYWTHPNPIEYYRRKAAKFAEVLVPDQVGPEHLLHVYVADQETKERVDALGTGLTVRVDRHLFFR
jgi:hypothetical protein